MRPFTTWPDPFNRFADEGWNTHPKAPNQFFTCGVKSHSISIHLSPHHVFPNTFLLHVIYRIQIRRPKSKFLKIFFKIFKIFKNSKFWFFFGCKSTWHTLLPLIPAFFSMQNARNRHCRRFHASNWPWPWKSFFDLWRSNGDLGQKVDKVLS